MAQKELKWYGILSILFGTVLGFADPITDTLTLVEFYRATFFLYCLIITPCCLMTRVVAFLHAYFVAIHFVPLL